MNYFLRFIVLNALILNLLGLAALEVQHRTNICKEYWCFVDPASQYTFSNWPT